MELMRNLLPLVIPGTAAASRDSADFRRTDLGALLPPGGAPWPTPADLAGVLPTWLVAATGNENAIDRFCLWAANSALPAAEALDALRILITDAGVAAKLSHLTDLFDYLQTVTLSAEDERRMHVWTGTFVKGRRQQVRQVPVLSHLTRGGGDDLPDADGPQMPNRVCQSRRVRPGRRSGSPVPERAGLHRRGDSGRG